MKTHNIETSVKEWFLMYKDKMYYCILEECEKEVNSFKTCVTVTAIKSMYGITYFNLSSPEDIVKSLSKCITHFVEKEEYELAARARDCSLAWASKEYIKKN